MLLTAEPVFVLRAVRVGFVLNNVAPWKGLFGCFGLSLCIVIRAILMLTQLSEGGRTLGPLGAAVSEDSPNPRIKIKCRGLSS